jgi:hypothetical protein
MGRINFKINDSTGNVLGIKKRPPFHSTDVQIFLKSWKNGFYTSVVDPNPKVSEYFGWIRIRKKSSDLDSDPDTVVK